MVGAHIGIRTGVVNGLHDGVHVQITGRGQVRRLTEVMISKVLHVAHVHGADPVHLSKMTDDCRHVVFGVGTQRAGAQAHGVGRAVMQLENLVKVLLAVGDTRQAEDGPGRIVRVAGHAHAHLLAHGNHRIQEVLEVLAQGAGRHVLVLLQRVLQQRQTLRLPAGQSKSTAALGSSAHNFQRAHFPQVLFIKVQAVGAILRNYSRQIGTQPIEDRHEVVHNHLDAITGQVADRIDIVLDVLITRGQAGLDVLVNVHAFDDFQLKPSRVDLIHQRLDILPLPHHAGRPVQKPHQARHAGDLLNVLQWDGVSLTAIPAKGHFHGSFSLLEHIGHTLFLSEF